MLDLKKQTTLAEAMKQYPGLLPVLTRLSPSYGLLGNATVRGLMAPRTSMAKIAQRGGMTYEELRARLSEAETELRQGAAAGPDHSEKVKEEIKAIVKRLTTADDVGPLKARFKELLREADPVIIAAAEAELAKEGLTTHDLMNACEIHLELFRETLDQAKIDVPKGHPLWRFTKDQDAILLWLDEGQALIGEASGKAGFDEAGAALGRLRQVVARLREAENHDTRQENTLFPVLEKYGIEEPPAVMWEEHSRMKDMRRDIEKLVAEPPPDVGFKGYIDRLSGLWIALTEQFIQHSTKEQRVLYPVALRLLSETDWREIKQECDDLGYFELPKEVLSDE